MKRAPDSQSAKAGCSRLADAFSLGRPTPAPQFLRAVEGALDSPAIPAWTRGLDLACTLLLLPAALPMMAFIAALIKAVSRGPVFLKQARVGYRGQRFVCLRFRSLKTDADNAPHGHHVQELLRSDTPMTQMDVTSDPRLIPFGAILRATGLDGLPQLINVLRGEMSLVGPRPGRPDDVERYLPWQQARFDTLPGLTGLWQVSGKDRTTWTEMMTLDVHYARHKSLRMDVMILAQTLFAMAPQLRTTRDR